MPKKTSKYVNNNNAQLSGLSDNASGSEVVDLSLGFKRKYLTYAALIGMGTLVFGAGYWLDKAKSDSN